MVILIAVIFNFAIAQTVPPVPPPTAGRPPALLPPGTGLPGAGVPGAGARGPIAPGYCPPGTLPQYCSTQIGQNPWARMIPPAQATPYGCPLGNVACMQQQQLMLSQYCPPSAFQYSCLQQRDRQLSMMRQQQQNQNAMQKIMPLLNGIGNAAGGGGSGTGSGSGSGPGGGERMANTDGSSGSTGSSGYTGGGASNSSGEPGTTSANSVNKGAARIVEPFQRHFPKCTNKLGLGNCTFKNLGIFGDARHRAQRSCHNSGDAWDIGYPMKCGDGKVIHAADPQAMEIAKCLASDSGDELGVIFRDQAPVKNMFPGGVRGQHNTHMHVQLRNCRNVTG